MQERGWIILLPTVDDQDNMISQLASIAKNNHLTHQMKMVEYPWHCHLTFPFASCPQSLTLNWMKFTCCLVLGCLEFIQYTRTVNILQTKQECRTWDIRKYVRDGCLAVAITGYSNQIVKPYHWFWKTEFTSIYW